MVKALCFCIILMNLANAMTLSQEDAAKLVIQQSTQVKEINSKYQEYFLAPAAINSAYDWKLILEGGNDVDRSEKLTASSAAISTQYFTNQYTFSTTLSKQLASLGTNLSLLLQRTSQKTEAATVSSSTVYPIQTLDSLGLTVEQPLWADFFGNADRASILGAEYSFKSNYILRLDELQTLVLNAIKLYWKAYVAEQKLNQDIHSRETYKKLVQSSLKKKSLGYTTPGELEQAQAEYENREQNVKVSSQDYLENMDNLVSLLNIPKAEEIKFSEVTELPLPPKEKSVDYSKLRPVQSQNLKTSSAEQAYEASKSKSHPTLNFVGKAYSASVDEDASISQSSMWSAKNPRYYVGLKFQYNFGSDVLNEDEINKKSAWELEKSVKERQLKEFMDRGEKLKRSVLTNYAVATSKKTQINLRKKAVDELTKTFNQGRTDISVLIDAMNKFYAAETDYTKSVGDYFIALNELSAFNDELVVNTNNTTSSKEGK